MSEPRPWIAWVVVATSIAAIATSAVTGTQARNHARCQARVNEDLARAVSVRAQATDQRDAAWDTFVDESLAATTAEQRATALAKWKAARAAEAQFRRDNPFPALPSQTCR